MMHQVGAASGHLFPGNREISAMDKLSILDFEQLEA